MIVFVVGLEYDYISAKYSQSTELLTMEKKREQHDRSTKI